MCKRILIVLLLLFNVSQSQNWEWAKSFPIGCDAYGKRIDVDSTGNCYILGNSRCSGSGGNNGTYSYPFFVKLDSIGNLSWKDSLKQGAFCVNDPLGDFYIIGSKIDRYDNGGQMLWSVPLNSNLNFQNVTAYPTGGIVAAGTAVLSGIQQSVISRFDKNGNCLWTKTGQFPVGGSTPFALTCDVHGHSFIAGDDGDSVAQGRNFGFLVQYDAQGNLLSRKTIPHTPNDITIDNQGNIFVTGWFSAYPITIQGTNYQSSYPGNPQPQYLVKYDKNANVLWSKMLTGQIGRDAITTDLNGNLFLTVDYTTLQIDGSSYGSGGGILVMKCDAGGNILWNVSSGSSSGGYAYPKDITVNARGEVFVTGGMSGTNAFGPFTLTQSGIYSSLLAFKLSDQNATSVFLSPDPVLPRLIVSPNPSDDIFCITFDEGAKDRQQINLVVENELGQVIYSEVPKDFSGKYSTNINLSRHRKGVYFVKVLVGNRSYIKKIILE